MSKWEQGIHNEAARPAFFQRWVGTLLTEKGGAVSGEKAEGRSRGALTKIERDVLKKLPVLAMLTEVEKRATLKTVKDFVEACEEREKEAEEVLVVRYSIVRRIVRRIDGHERKRMSEKTVAEINTVLQSAMRTIDWYWFSRGPCPEGTRNVREICFGGKEACNGGGS